MQEVIHRENDLEMDIMEKIMSDNFPLLDCPIKHYFSPGLYVREILMKTDGVLASRIHRSCHPYTISKGKVAVSIDGAEWEILEAGKTGITIPGTRRLLIIIEDCTWCTYHALPFITGEENKWSKEKQDELADLIGEMIIEPHENELLGGVVKNNIIYKAIQNEN